MTLFKSDIDQLNTLAVTLENAGNAIDAVDIRSALSAVHAALVACDIVQVCDQSGEFIEGAYLRVAERERQVAAKARECAAAYAMTDENFKKELDKFDFHSSGGR
ncbi:hypothetical protein [Nocardia sp. NPDC056100]|uniref:hypothetical protein n=1 Tax=Nocardia sp. NPDC056100 TaxID=3345712 RepID=UPI0035E058D1